jgi:hypothetical protein
MLFPEYSKSPWWGAEITERAVVQSFDGMFASGSKACVRSMPNLSPNILRAVAAPPIGTSISACYGSDTDCYPGKSKILTYGFHSEFPSSFEISETSAPSTAGTCIRSGIDKGNTALTNPDHLKRQLPEVGYDSFRRLGDRTDVLAS